MDRAQRNLEITKKVYKNTMELYFHPSIIIDLAERILYTGINKTLLIRRSPSVASEEKPDGFQEIPDIAEEAMIQSIMETTMKFVSDKTFLKALLKYYPSLYFNETILVAIMDNNSGFMGDDIERVRAFEYLMKRRGFQFCQRLLERALENSCGVEMRNCMVQTDTNIKDPSGTVNQEDKSDNKCTARCVLQLEEGDWPMELDLDCSVINLEVLHLIRSPSYSCPLLSARK